MDENSWNEWNNNLKEKLGEESYSLISGELGELLTKNNESLETINKQKDEIDRLNSNNTKLSHANAQLLQQIPVATIKEPESETTETEFSFYDQFDKNGKFKR